MTRGYSSTVANRDRQLSGEVVARRGHLDNSVNVVVVLSLFSVSSGEVFQIDRYLRRDVSTSRATLYNLNDVGENGVRSKAPRVSVPSHNPHLRQFAYLKPCTRTRQDYTQWRREGVCRPGQTSIIQVYNLRPLQSPTYYLSINIGVA